MTDTLITKGRTAVITGAVTSCAVALVLRVESEMCRVDGELSR
jgi:hypothetical protein